MYTAMYMAVLACLIFAGSILPASAYLDAGTGSMIIQAVIGAVVGGLVFAKFYWYKLKSYFSRSSSNADSHTDDAKG